MNLNPELAASFAPLLTSDPSPSTVMYSLLLTAWMEYIPAAAPTFWRITNVSQDDAVLRVAESV